MGGAIDAHPLQVLWHSQKPVMCVDFDGTRRFATCGADAGVKIWRLVDGGAKGLVPEYRAGLNQHEKTVNVVRFSPDGRFLASAGDDRMALVWQETPGAAPAAPLAGEAAVEDAGCETWAVRILLKGHVEDVYDLAWAPSGNALLTGSVDNTVILWAIDFGKNTGRALQRFSDHTHFVQGVAWDPLGIFVASQSSDRSVRVYHRKTTTNKKTGQTTRAAKFTQARLIHKGDPVPAVEAAPAAAAPSAADPAAAPPKSKEPARLRLFMDENMPTFFRRLTWSPDGAVLVLPAGQKADGKDALAHTAFIFGRNNFERPLAQLELGPDASPVVAVRFSPLLYELVEGRPAEILDFKYRMVFAVMTTDALFIFDTQRAQPLAHIANLHCTTLTDVAWNRDGTILLVTSVDGYVSRIVLSGDALGHPYGGERPAYMTCIEDVLPEPRIKGNKAPAPAPQGDDSAKRPIDAAADRPDDNDNEIDAAAKKARTVVPATVA